MNYFIHTLRGPWAWKFRMTKPPMVMHHSDGRPCLACDEWDAYQRTWGLFDALLPFLMFAAGFALMWWLR